ncbi:hypothetical protein GUITHDRAFT_112445 [Guillardia theta CCMP2712]|uniref:Uncharacterized protein n=1 Tax=Guillardia theta (strain CCMP2712) TaxID=905079 RepID=L1IZY4_GUITC|nr:hypothetical protein GUITHDRAFT_112445 [Guillardia theta CCMP2712]EKX41474.1 hypothetical protein GUITHDRAFT_112445 [Guillardia theta CCMP2712]|eukprot:XP_005828454.1 hypothetical protein GUITHDRAFT_112445 [Guillardia theta CCMP2712]
MEEVEEPEMSEYEKFRAQNLQRNLEVLKMLGIEAETFQPAMRSPDKDDSSDGLQGGTRRKSARLRGLTVDGSELVEEMRELSERKRQKQEMKVKHYKEAEQLIEEFEISDRKQKSLFQHTVHRIRTMSEKQLRTRIKVIENARGSQALLKMKLFAIALKCEDYPELSQEAEDSYQRLVEVLGRPAWEGSLMFGTEEDIVELS